MKKIVVLGTGGTIAGTASDPSDNVGYVAGQMGVEDLVHAVPQLAGLPIASEQVANIDSCDMDFGVWQALAGRCAHWLAQDDVAGVVITHGTDTLEETAFFLRCVLDARKPVVLTCAMRPATALSPDGPQNLLDAVAVARTVSAQGVVCVCAGVVHDALHVTKVHPYRLDAFGSGDAGPVGHVEEGRVRLVREWPGTAAAPGVLQRVSAARAWPRVEIVTSHAGASGAVVRGLLGVGVGVDGIVVAATGNGTVHHALAAALKEASDAGVRVLRSTRCPQGVIVGPTSSEGAASTALSPVKARVAMVLDLLA